MASRGQRDLLYDPEDHGDLFIGLNPKDQRDIIGRCYQLYYLKGHGDLFGWFDLVYDPKWSQGHYRSL